MGCDVSSDVMLVDYLRDRLGLCGTKYMCREGGCGGCVVSAQTPSAAPCAINSVSILIVDVYYNRDPLERWVDELAVSY